MPRTRLDPACLLLPLLLSAAPVVAQPQPRPTVVTPSPPPREGTVGPEQLRDFALPGTRPAAPTNDATVVPTPPAQSASPAGTPAGPTRTEAPPPRRSDSVALPEAAPRPAPGNTERTLPAEQITVDLDAASAGPIDGLTPTVPTLPPPPGLPAEAPAPEGSHWWPWLAVAALAGAALAFYLRRRNRREAFAGDPQADATPPSAPAPTPTREEPALPTGLITTRLNREPRAAARPPLAPPPPTGAIVSTGLRPWVDCDLEVLEVLFGDAEVELRFRLRLANSGAATARNIAIEALGLNAGDNQAEELARFYARPEGSAAAIEALPRLGTTEVTHAVRMPRGAIQLYESQGRRLFVPILTFNVSYAWGGGSGRTGAAFLVGLARPGSERLAPLRLDAGEARLTGLSARRLDEQVRR